VEAVSGCCFLVRRSVLDEVGFLDEDFFMYAEETDLCYRAWQAGFEVHYAPVGEIVPLHGASSRLDSRRTFLESSTMCLTR
jgi:GT2 family glycosyltransferase